MPDAWLADLGRPAARAAFVQRVDELLAGQPGRALVLNLVGAAADLTALLDDPRPLAVLAPDLPDPAAIVPLDRTAAEPAKKAPPPPGTDDRSRRLRAGRRLRRRRRPPASRQRCRTCAAACG